MSGPRAAMAPPSADQRAIDRVRAGPDHDQGQRRRVGHAGRHPTDDPGDDQDLDRRRESGQQAGRDRQQHAEDEHELPPIAIPECAEPEHRRGQTERIADGNEIEGGLRRAERRADVREGDIRYRQVQVGDGRDEDQGQQDKPGLLGRLTCVCHVIPLSVRTIDRRGGPCTSEPRGATSSIATGAQIEQESSGTGQTPGDNVQFDISTMYVPDIDTEKRGAQ